MPNRMILIAVALMLSIAMGLRQSLGLFLQPLTRDLSLQVADFTIAIAVQNVAWGLLQPVAGGLAARLGFRRLMMAGATCYLAGLLVLATARGMIGVTVGAGVLIGAALACTASAMALAVAARAVPARIRSTVLGLVTAAGSLGSVIAAPMGQILSDDYGWRAGVWGFAALACVMLPAAWLAGRVDRVPLPVREAGAAADTSARVALRAAFANGSFLIMTGAYFVCGMQLIFLATHLPSYLALCGMDPMLSAKALAVIAAFNVVGSLFFGWAGGRWSKQALLGGLYITRSARAGGVLRGAADAVRHAGVRCLHGLPVARCRTADLRLGGRDVRPALAGDDPGRRLHEPPDRQLPGRAGSRPAVRPDGQLRPHLEARRRARPSRRHLAADLRVAPQRPPSRLEPRLSAG